MHAFTGPRFIDSLQQQKIYTTLVTLKEDHWYVGDAKGLDAFVVATATELKKTIHYFEIGGTEKWRFTERSKRMVDEFIKDGGKMLYAFPNKDCPKQCYPGSKTWGGSGTWGTIAYARSKGLEVSICPIADIKLPNWYTQIGRQLTLF